MKLDNITYEVIGTALKVHSSLGPGLLESSYQEVMFYELVKRGYYVQKELALPVVYEKVKLNVGYRIDLLVEKHLVVEIKSVEALKDIHIAQVLTYLRLGNFKMGLLLNFNVTSMKNGIKRLINSNKT